MKFTELGLEPKILDALNELGYETPTPIQAEAIPPALLGKDVLGIAQTGTGKTASFTLPMIHNLSKGRAKARMPRSVVLAPTRELAAQVAESFEQYGKYHKLTMALLIGGVSFNDQDALLARGVDVLIATPGRLIDHFERGKLLLTGVQMMVVDEADRMLDMGFMPDIERIFKMTPFTRQTLFFSATMPPEIQRITDQFLSAPVRIEVARPATTADTIRQMIVNQPTGDEKLKRNTLRYLLDMVTVKEQAAEAAEETTADESADKTAKAEDATEAENAEEVAVDTENAAQAAPDFLPLKNGIIFCNRKKTVDIVAKSLSVHGYDARAIHGDLPQSYRMETLEGFRNGEIQLLVASDVAARGLDIPEVSHVFNFDVPVHADDYVHRIGRTGRAGRQGMTFMLVAPYDEKSYKAVLAVTKQKSIEEIDLKDFFAEQKELLKNRKRGDKRSSRQDRNEKRGRRGRNRDDRQKDDQVDNQIDESASNDKPKDNDRRDKRDRRDRNDRRHKRYEDRPYDRNGRRDPNYQEDIEAMTHADNVKGFGDHVPAFILVEAAKSAEKPAEKSEEKSED